MMIVLTRESEKNSVRQRVREGRRERLRARKGEKNREREDGSRAASYECFSAYQTQFCAVDGKKRETQELISLFDKIKIKDMR